MDAKDVIRKAKFHITNMQRFGITPQGSCVYLRDGRPACLIGKIYADKFKGRPNLNGSAGGMYRQGVINCSGVPQPGDFLNKLQRIHDSVARGGVPERRVTPEEKSEMLDRLQGLASAFGLADALD